MIKLLKMKVLLISILVCLSETKNLKQNVKSNQFPLLKQNSSHQNKNVQNQSSRVLANKTVKLSSTQSSNQDHFGLSVQSPHQDSNRNNQITISRQGQSVLGIGQRNFGNRSRILQISPAQLTKIRNTDRGLDLQLVPSDFRNSIKLKKVFRIQQQIQKVNPSILLLNNIKRNINGSNNNLIHKDFGVANSLQKRHCKPVFQGQKFMPVSNRPSPREISNVVGKPRQKLQLNKNNVTMAFTIWGQFIDHDIQITPGSTTQSLEIPIPKCDDFFDIDCNGTFSLPFARTKVADDEPQKRLPFNGITTWIDASMVYGSSETQAKKLRSFQRGRMKTDSLSERVLPEGPNVKNSTEKTMQGGDIRSNQNSILLTYQVLFLRQHNRLCDIISKQFRNLKDDDIYNIVKNYVAGLIQKITFDDYLTTLFGRQKFNQLIGEYKGYDNTIDPTLEVQFTTTAYRFGHSLITNFIPFVNFMGDKFQFKMIDDLLFRPDLMDNMAFQRVIRGASRTVTKQRDGQFVEQLRNFLVLGPQFRNIKMDLLALNILRGRDSGIPDFNSLRQCYGLPRFKQFSQISAQKQKNEQIEKVYKQIDKIDSYVGIQTQKNVGDGILGETSMVIIAKGFRNIRDGDRFWYEKVFPPDIVKQIKETKLSHLFLRNSLIRQLQQDLFHYHFGIP